MSTKAPLMGTSVFSDWSADKVVKARIVIPGSNMNVFASAYAGTRVWDEHRDFCFCQHLYMFLYWAGGYSAHAPWCELTSKVSQDWRVTKLQHLKASRLLWLSPPVTWCHIRVPSREGRGARSSLRVDTRWARRTGTARRRPWHKENIQRTSSSATGGQRILAWAINRCSWVWFGQERFKLPSTDSTWVSWVLKALLLRMSVMSMENPTGTRLGSFGLSAKVSAALICYE